MYHHTNAFFGIPDPSGGFGDVYPDYYHTESQLKFTQIYQTPIIVKDDSASEKKREMADFKMKYKTEICKFWLEKGDCEFGTSCAFAHGDHEIRQKIHIPSNYKTKKCKNFFKNGFCAYGPRCQFLHNSPERTNSEYNSRTRLFRFYYQRVLTHCKECFDWDHCCFKGLCERRKRLPIFQKIFEKAQNYEASECSNDSHLCTHCCDLKSQDN